MKEKQEETGFIYKTISPNGKIYIGQTINFEQRCRKYKGNAFKGQKKLWNSCQKYSWNPIDNIEVIDKCIISELDLKEIYWIEYYDSYNKGLNSDLGGKGRRGFKHTKETKEKLKVINLGKKHTNETKIKISISTKGKTKSDKRKSLDGRKLTVEHIEKIKETKRRNPYKMTDEQKKKVSLSNIGNKKRLGKKHSDKTKNKISETKKGISNKSLSVKIICVNTGVIYESQTDAAKKLNLKQQSISRVCNKGRDKYKGLVFMFYDEYLKTINNG